MMDGFKYIDRGKGSTALLLPGWASDHRIFDSLDVDYDYLIPQNIHRLDIPEGFGKYYGDKKIALIGWSLGGLLGAEIFLKFPHIIDKAVFVGVREIYPADEIEVMRVHLRKNKKRYLKFFYRQCFKGHRSSDIDWFYSELISGYLEDMDICLLEHGLDYLKENMFPVDRLKEYEKRIIFVHGMNDAVTPVTDTVPIKKVLDGASFRYLEGTGHVSFLDPRFKEIMDGLND